MPLDTRDYRCNHTLLYALAEAGFQDFYADEHERNDDEWKSYLRQILKTYPRVKRFDA